MAQSSRPALRKRILSLAPGQEQKLSHRVVVPKPKGWEGQPDLHVVALYRRGANGVACVLDEVDQCWFLSELTDEACAAVLSAL
jgi:hypothetical protein|nr:MAG TPA: hypothetical protein [Caudoviricetes sp.]